MKTMWTMINGTKNEVLILNQEEMFRIKGGDGDGDEGPVTFPPQP